MANNQKAVKALNKKFVAQDFDETLVEWGVDLSEEESYTWKFNYKGTRYVWEYVYSTNKINETTIKIK